MNAPVQSNTKAQLLQNVVEHVDITSFDARPIIDSMRKMSFSSRDTARAADIFSMAIEDKDCSPWLILAGSTSAGGCMHVYRDMVKFGMVDAVVATGASIVDMDFFEALGFKHYQAAGEVDDNVLRDNYIDRIYDTYIDEEELQACDHTILEIANRLEPRGYSSREFIWEMGKWLSEGNAKKPGSLIQTAYEQGVPIFCPAFVDSSAGFGLVKHQKEQAAAGQPYLMLDAIADFRELTDIKIAAGVTGLFMVGGGVPKNFAQDTVVCAEILGVEAEMHRYAVQITVADVRDGACSSSTLKEAASWGKVQTTHEQMVFAEATTVVPLIGSDAYHRGAWKAATSAAGTSCLRRAEQRKRPVDCSAGLLSVSPPLRSGGAGLEAGLQRGFVQIAADEDRAAPAAFGGAPFALQIALKDHVHGLEDQAAILALHVDDALGAQDVLTLLAQQLVQPGGELRPVQRPVQRQGNALDVVLVGVTSRAVRMIVIVVMIIVPVIMVMMPMIVTAGLVMHMAVRAVRRVHEVRLDLQDPLQIEGAQAQHLIERHV